MHASRSTLTIALLASLGLAPSAAARTSLSVCGLLTAKEVAAIKGVSAKCTNAKPTAGPGSKIYVGNWAGKTPTSANAQVTITQYTDPGVLQIAKRNLDQGLPGTPSKVTGIGSAAYAASGASSTAIHFNVGNYIAIIVVTTSGSSSASIASVEAVAKAVAAKL